MSSTKKQVGAYILDEKIGKGSFAEVWKGKVEATGEPVAVKVISRNTVQETAQLKQEVSVLKKISSPHIVRFRDLKKSATHFYLILEYCNGGDLSSYIQRHGVIKEDLGRLFLRQLASGLSVLHRHNFIHRDLKPQNILLIDDKPPLLRIADFGFSRALLPQDMAATICGSPLYMAPEILRHDKYDSKADLWSVGAILFECFCGKPPYNGPNPMQLLANIEKADDLTFPEKCDLSERGRKFLKSLLEKDPSKRLSSSDFVKHNYVASDLELDATNLCLYSSKVNEDGVLIEKQEQKQVLGFSVSSEMARSPNDSSSPNAPSSFPNIPKTASSGASSGSSKDAKSSGIVVSSEGTENNDSNDATKSARRKKDNQNDQQSASRNFEKVDNNNSASSTDNNGTKQPEFVLVGEEAAAPMDTGFYTSLKKKASIESQASSPAEENEKENPIKKKSDSFVEKQPSIAKIDPTETNNEVLRQLRAGSSASSSPPLEKQGLENVEANRGRKESANQETDKNKDKTSSSSAAADKEDNSEKSAENQSSTPDKPPDDDDSKFADAKSSANSSANNLFTGTNISAPEPNNAVNAGGHVPSNNKSEDQQPETKSESNSPPLPPASNSVLTQMLIESKEKQQSNDVVVPASSSDNQPKANQDNNSGQQQITKSNNDVIITQQPEPDEQDESPTATQFEGRKDRIGSFAGEDEAHIKRVIELFIRLARSYFDMDCPGESAACLCEAMRLCEENMKNSQNFRRDSTNSSEDGNFSPKKGDFSHQQKICTDLLVLWREKWFSEFLAENEEEAASRSNSKTAAKKASKDPNAFDPAASDHSSPSSARSPRPMAFSNSTFHSFHPGKLICDWARKQAASAGTMLRSDLRENANSEVTSTTLLRCKEKLETSLLTLQFLKKRYENAENIDAELSPVIMALKALRDNCWELL